MNEFYINFLSSELHYLKTMRYALISVFVIIVSLFITSFSTLSNKTIIAFFFCLLLIFFCYMYYMGERIQKVINYIDKLREKEFLGSTKSEEVIKLLEVLRNLDL